MLADLTLSHATVLLVHAVADIDSIISLCLGALDRHHRFHHLVWLGRVVVVLDSDCIISLGLVVIIDPLLSLFRSSPSTPSSRFSLYLGAFSVVLIVSFISLFLGAWSRFSDPSSRLLFFSVAYSD